MSLPQTYNDLVTKVKELFEDDGTEFSTFIPTAINIAETEMARVVDTNGVISNVEVTATMGNRSVTLPSGFKLAHTVKLVQSDSVSVLKRVEEDVLYDYWPVSASTGVPVKYSIPDNSTFLLAPTPNSTYTPRVRCEKQPTLLSSGNQTNYFTDFCSDALFYGTCLQMAIFSRNSVLEQTYERLYGRALQSIQNEGRRQRQDSTTTPYNLNPRVNTVKEGTN